MDNCVISIIIPVYNVEKYLRRCMDSILRQCLDEVEVLLIDDGSKDDSGKMCDEYSNKYNNVYTIHQNNGGLSEARNTGIRAAHGKYLMFIDSDDYIKQNCIAHFIEDIKRTNCDVIVGKALMLFDDGHTQPEEHYTMKKRLYSSKEYARCLYENRKSVAFCAQYHICKKDLIVKNKLYFQKGILHEDELWTPKILLTAKTIYYSDRYFYYHYMREGSIMHSNNFENRGKSLVRITKGLLKYYSTIEQTDLRYYYDRMVSFYLQAVYMIPNYTKIGRFGRTMPIKHAYYSKTILKSFLYLLSPRLFVWLHGVVMVYRKKIQ